MRKNVGLILVVLGLSTILMQAHAAEDPIKIAAIFAKTGIAADANIPDFEGVRFAVEELNLAGGLLGRPITLIELDNKSTPLGSKIAATQAVKQGVTAVIGASWSSHSLRVAPVLQQAKIPMISNFSTNPEVTKIGDYIFRVCFIDSFQGNALAQFAQQDLEAKSVVILTNISSEYSAGLARFFADAFSEKGGSVLWEGEYQEKDIDFSQQLKKTQVLQPDLIFIPGYPRDSGFIIKQARKLGIQSLFLGGDAWDIRMYDFGGDEIIGNYYSQHWHSSLPFSQNQQLLKRFKEKYGRRIEIANMPLSYDAVMVLAEAIRRTNSLDRQKIRDALAATKGFEGATGMLTFDQNGDPVKGITIMKFEKDTPVLVKSLNP